MVIYQFVLIFRRCHWGVSLTSERLQRSLAGSDTAGAIEECRFQRRMDKRRNTRFPEEGEVTAVVPIDFRMLPMFPQVMNVFGRNDTVAAAGKNETSRLGDERLQMQR